MHCKRNESACEHSIFLKAASMSTITSSPACRSFERECHEFLAGRSRLQLLLCRRHLHQHRSHHFSLHSRHVALLSFIICLSISLLLGPPVISYLSSEPCLIPTNFIISEASRPLANCSACRPASVVHLHRPTPGEFAPHAYAGRPVLVSGALRHWRALEDIDYAFIKRLYARLRSNETATPAAAAAVGQDGCQFLAFRSQLESLDQLLMAEEQLHLQPTTAANNSWYIGWSNCDPRVAAALRGLYRWPEFLPADGEASAIDWIFMGTPGQGTAMHIDNVRRPSWQAQVRGAKRWRLRPPPECERVCQPFTVNVRGGQMFLLDTNQWYHSTEVIGDEMSITIGSEYD